ncbi:MAG: hypothetical protein ACI4KG_08275 [Oscillospiraceae bacterium]
MKKYCFFIAFVLYVSAFSGCSVNKPATVVYTDSPPPLTVMTEITTTPADTYSQYMETYTPPTTTGTDVYYYHLPPSENIGADTGMYSILKPNAPQQDMPYRDTAAVRNSAVTETEAAETTDVSSGRPEETSETQIPETAAPSADTSYYPERPSADTGFSGMISADTAHSAQTVTTAPSETSGTSEEQ